jgi:hypothetical protein
MMQAVLVVVVGSVAVAVAALLRRRDADAPDQGPSWAVPTQLDRADFIRPEAPWLVAVFTSATCLSCSETWQKVEILDSADVAVQEAEAVERADLHARYHIDAVPMVLVADATGAVVRSFLGPPSTSDLWAAVADVRDDEDA